MALFNDDVQQYLTLLNDISQQTFDSQYEQGMKYIKEHFAARGLSASGAIQDAMQTYLGKHTAALSLAKTRNAALAWQLQTGRNTQQQQQDWYEKQQQNALKQDGSVSDAMAIQNAMDDQSDNFNQSPNYAFHSWNEGYGQGHNVNVNTYGNTAGGLYGQAATNHEYGHQPSEPFDISAGNVYGTYAPQFSSTD